MGKYLQSCHGQTGNSILKTCMIKAGTAEKIRNWNNTVLETANNELSNVSFTGALGNVHFDNNGESKVAVNSFQIRNKTAELYTVISDRQCNETAIGRSQGMKIPQFSICCYSCSFAENQSSSHHSHYSHPDSISLLS